MDLGLQSMAPSSVCINQSQIGFPGQYSSSHLSGVKSAHLSSLTTECEFNAWKLDAPGPRRNSVQSFSSEFGKAGNPEQRPLILFRLLQQPELTETDFQTEQSSSWSSIEPRSQHVNSESPHHESKDVACSETLKCGYSTRDQFALLDRDAPRSLGSIGESGKVMSNESSRSSSQCSVSSNEEAPDDQSIRPKMRPRTESFLESTRNKLVNLTTSEVDESPALVSLPKSGQTTTDKRRSHSNRSAPHSDLDPIDLTCKRRCSRELGFPGRMNDSSESGHNYKDGIGCVSLSETSLSDSSILKSILTGRSRSLSFSGRITTLPGKIISGNSRQRVTLAKRNMMPVVARIADRLTAAVAFARSLPEFLHFSSEDQTYLLVQSCPRLLLLYLAEANFHFAVTPVRFADPTDDQRKTDQCLLEEPTVQFVEMVQNFIAKCQSMAISTTEYFYMRLILLFHAGSGAGLHRSDLAKKISSEAVQDLHALVTDNHEIDKLRYSKLLLTLYTLFGINCAMVESLFCRQLLSLGGIRAFVQHELGLGTESRGKQSS